MNRRMLVSLVLPVAVAAAPGETPEGWLAGPATTPTSSPGRTVRVDTRERDLGDVLPLLLKLAFPDGSVRSAVPPREDLRKVTVRARGSFVQVLEAVGAAADLHLVRVGDEIRSHGIYRAPPPRPPTGDDLAALSKDVRLRASEQDLGDVISVLATFAGKTAIVPGTERRRRVTVNLGGNLAQALETLGAVTDLRLWIDGPLLRVGRSCIRRERAYARPPPERLEKISLRANGQELGKIANVLATFWGSTIPVVATPHAMRQVSLDLKDATPLQVTAAIEDQLPGVEVYLDGPFLRIQTKALACDPPPAGPAWEGLEELLYRSPKPRAQTPD